jgi:sigma-B regulation protein RsbU (phosphoserine phosphatase)
VLAATNEATLDDLTNAGLFITMFCARYEPATGVLRFSSGGHNPPLLRTTAGIEELDPDGMPAGLMGEVEYEEHERVLRAGDQLLLYTDGCVEARDPAGVQFGLERLVELMEHAPDAPDVLVRDIYAAVDHYTEGHNSQDDLTLVALTVLPDEGGAQ